MFTGISWGTYATLVALLTTGWYVYVLMRYYRAQIKQRFKGKTLPAPATAGTQNFFIAEKTGQQTAPPPAQSEIWQDTAQQDEASHLTQRSKEMIFRASQNSFNKAEFLAYLGQLFREYPSLKGSPYQGVVSEILQKKCAGMGLAVSEQEIDMLW